MLRLVSLARLDADTRVRLLEAAWQAMEVRDDRIISVTDVVASDGELSIVSDYVEGLALRSISGLASVRRKPIPVSVALRFIADLTDGVVALHRAMAELGDEAVPLFGGLSVDSVLVGADGRTSLLDVAVAGAASSVESLGGSPERVAYAAPEQVGAGGPVDARTDVFSLGALAWEMLSSRRLFVGSDKGVVQKVLAAKIPRLDDATRKGDFEIPKPVAAAVMKALAREPGERFQSVEAFRAALSGFTPAPPSDAADYVATIADGALARTREALSLPPRPRPVIAAKPAVTSRVSVDPKPAAAPRAGIDAKLAAALRASIDPRPVTPLRTNVDPRPAPLPRTSVEAKSAVAAPKTSPEPRAAAAPRSDVEPAPVATSPRVSIDPKAAAARPSIDPKPGAGWRALDAPPSVKTVAPAKVRPRQVTMIGLPPPADLRTESALEQPLPTPPMVTPEPPPVAEEPSPPAPALSREPAFPSSAPPPSSSDEPTTQYSREHLKQLAELHTAKPSAPSPPQVELPRLVSLQPTPRPLSELHTERPPPPEPLAETPQAAPPGYAVATLPAPPTDAQYAAPAYDQHPRDARAAAPLPPARADAAPVRVAAAPAPARIDAPFQGRALERPAFSRPPPATPQASYLPSQIAPPLIRDPRANRMPAGAPRGAPHFTRGVVLGVVVSLALVAASTAVALYFMRERAAANAETVARTPVALERSAALGRSEAVAPPQPEPPSVAASAAPAVASAEAPPEASASAEAATAVAAAPSASTEPATPEPAVAAPNPAAPPRAAAHAPAARAPRATPKQPAKKKTRFVPADI
jgi:serine/threonine-protein kinase